MNVKIAKTVTSKEIIDWIDKELDRLRAAGRNAKEAIHSSAFVSYACDLEALKGEISLRSHLRSDDVTVDEILADLQQLQSRLPCDAIEPAFQYYLAYLSYLEKHIYHIAWTIAQSKLGEKA